MSVTTILDWTDFVEDSIFFGNGVGLLFVGMGSPGRVTTPPLSMVAWNLGHIYL